MKYEKIQLGDVLHYEQPTKYIVQSTRYVNDASLTPVLTAGKTFILGYTKETNGILNEGLPVIIFDDFTTASKFVDFPFKVKSSAMKILRIDNNRADARYLFYLMQSLQFSVVKHKRHWISEYSKIEISLPPLVEQKHIADRLDKVSAFKEKTLSAIKDTERLFVSISKDNFADVKNKSETKTVGEICEIEKGQSPIQKTPAGNYPLVVTAEDRKTANTFQLDCEAVCIPLVSSTGHGHASLNRVHYEKGKFALGNIIVALIPKYKSGLLAKYLYYYLSYYKDSLLVPLMRGVANMTIPMEEVGTVNVEVPTLNLQKQTVAKLEEVEKLKQMFLQRQRLVEQYFQSVLKQTFNLTT